MGQRKPLLTECLQCKGPMPTTGRFRRYCTQRCSDQSYRERTYEHRSAYNREWQRANRDKTRDIQQRYYRRHGERINATARAKTAEPGVGADRWQRRQQRIGRSAALEEIRAGSLARRYGLTARCYEELLAAQAGQCAICGKTAEENGRRLAVDHDHRCCSGRQTCGKCLRGLLCSPCNQRLGTLEDLEWVMAARTYLARYGELGDVHGRSTIEGDDG